MKFILFQDTKQKIPWPTSAQFSPVITYEDDLTVKYLILYGPCIFCNISVIQQDTQYLMINPLEPKDIYVCRTAQLTSRRCILNIYSTNIITEYFKHAAYSPFSLSLSLFKMPFIS